LAQLLHAAQTGGYALGAFNVYNLEGARAVVAAAEATRSPAILQLHPGALGHGGQPLVVLCLAAAAAARVPIVVHLDHAAEPAAIQAALEAGVPSIMADGSHLQYSQNMAFTQEMSALARSYGATVEAELGRLSGSEDGLTVAEYQAQLTDPAEAADFVQRTQVDALAVCVGNVHGRYSSPPQLDLARLSAIQRTVPVPLVLHGASGLPDAMVREAIAQGVAKINVNTELRDAYVAALRARLSADAAADVVDLMGAAVAAMQAVIAAKLELFGSVGRAETA
jgi:tagatose 1,6-diphosphate aldolase GatY/KbaY